MNTYPPVVTDWLLKKADLDGVEGSKGGMYHPNHRTLYQEEKRLIAFAALNALNPSIFLPFSRFSVLCYIYTPLGPTSAGREPRKARLLQVLPRGF